MTPGRIGGRREETAARPGPPGKTGHSAGDRTKSETFLVRKSKKQPICTKKGTFLIFCR